VTGVLRRCRPTDASTRVRESPPTYAVVVTQFVTHRPSGLGLAFPSPESCPEAQTSPGTASQTRSVSTATTGGVVAVDFTRFRGPSLTVRGRSDACCPAGCAKAGTWGHPPYEHELRRKGNASWRHCCRQGAGRSTAPVARQPSGGPRVMTTRRADRGGGREPGEFSPPTVEQWLTRSLPGVYLTTPR